MAVPADSEPSGSLLSGLIDSSDLDEVMMVDGEVIPRAQRSDTSGRARSHSFRASDLASGAHGSSLFAVQRGRIRTRGGSVIAKSPAPTRQRKGSKKSFANASSGTHPIPQLPHSALVSMGGSAGETTENSWALWD